MKKTLTSMLLIIVLAITSMTTALATGAPDWRSYFTSSKYNKTFTDKDGIKHKWECSLVTEGWNKVGTVYYNVYYIDTYTTSDGVIHSGEMVGENRSYKNACPVYPDAPKYTYYGVRHYRDHDEVTVDYRSGLPKATSTPKATTTPKATAKATPKSTAKPTSKPTEKATSKPTATAKTTPSPVATAAPVTPSPTATASPSVTPSATATVIASPTSPAPTATPSPEISATATVTPMASTTIQVTTATMTLAISATPTATDAPAAAPPTQQHPMYALLIGSVIALPILGGVIYAVLHLRRAGRK